MLQLADGLVLHLAHALARDLEDAAHFLEGVGVAVADAVAELQDLALAVGEGAQDVVDPLAQELAGGGLVRAGLALVLDEVAEVAVLALADRAVERDRVTAHLHDAAGLLDRHLRAERDLLDRRLATQFLQQVLLDGAELRHRLDHVHRHADGAGMVGDGARDGLADPPGGVGAELVAALVLVLVHRAHQAGVAFLDDVEEGQAAVAVLLGDGDHQAQVAAREVALGLLILQERALDAAHAPVERLGVLEHHAAQAVHLVVHDLDVFRVEALGVLLGLLELVLDLLDLLVEALQLAQERLDAAGAQAAFLEEHRHLAAVVVELLLERGALGLGGRGVERLEDLAVAVEQALDGREVGGNARREGLLVVLLGGRDAHGAVEGQGARVHLLQDLHGHLRRVVAGQREPAEAHARGLDLLRQADLLLAREERDRAHLREVHADRVVDPLGALLVERSLHSSLRLGVVEDLLLGGRLLGQVLLVLEAAIEVDRRAVLLVDHLDLRRLVRLLLVALELEVRLQRGVEHLAALALALALVDELDAELLEEDDHLVNLLGLDELVGHAADVLLVGDPLAAAADLDKLAKDGGQVGKCE